MPVCPFDVSVERIARLLNCEFAEHPIYEGLELQVFDDDRHGRGLLAFLSRRADRTVDFYVQPGLTLDRSHFRIGGGIGRWGPASFEASSLIFAKDGVVADVRFVDDDGRSISVQVDDRDGRARRRSRLLAPVSAAIEDPQSMMFVYMTGFDLLRTAGVARVTIDDEEVSTGRLPMEWLHRRRLVKVSDGLTVVHLNRVHDGPRDAGTLEAREGEHAARLELEPPLGSLEGRRDGPHRGRWGLVVDGDRLTGGAYVVERRGDRTDISLDVTEAWRPKQVTPLVRLVTRIVPTFRQWPTTYRWTGHVDASTDPPRLTSAWTRDGNLADVYRKATGSS